ncbi:uncharacterized protein LOC133784618 [Humulus lupulus]|uniref:uncharacterized protein LOC133784618 n=1 Tax=Humulus lupulus TaxID=3486 RepID=UPI002B41319E|nr:uncharacterized protein LOC133784618 [Humulus lupulus]
MPSETAEESHGESRLTTKEIPPPPALPLRPTLLEEGESALRDKQSRLVNRTWENGRCWRDDAYKALTICRQVEFSNRPAEFSAPQPIVDWLAAEAGFRPKLGQNVAPMAADLLDQVGSTMSNLQLKRYATIANPDVLFISQALRHQATAGISPEAYMLQHKHKTGTISRTTGSIYGGVPRSRLMEPRSHRAASSGIFNEGDEWCTSDSEISEITMKFYNSLFTSSSPSEEKIEELLQGVHTSVSDEMNMSLEAPFSLEEIKDAVFSMPADKSPGPDVRYSFQINGVIYGEVIPSRGLRQGDPLSPYLFLVCAEGFSSLLQQAESRKEIKGLRLANTAPFITHLFFADDSLIIVQASERSLQAIQNIFSLYSTCSGQMINFTKSLLYFSPNTSEEIATLYTSFLNIQRTDSIETYLGLPMLGVVIQAMPTYLMSCFRIPEGLCQEIERIQARYWWGSTTEQRKVHWHAWHKMCRPKCKGGLGFRGFIQYNQALLAKQAWGLLINPTSLLAKVLKARYYQHTSLLEAREGHYPSITWRSIIWGRDLLRRGLRRRIGNGKETLAFSDPWIPRPPSFLPSIIDISDPLRVHDLFETPDSWLWHYTNHGNYSVKSGYNLASAMDTALPSSSVTLIAIWWKSFGGIKIPRKILHFAWRGYHEIFPTLKGLNRRNISKHNVCPLCGFGEDSNAHAVFWCPSSKEIWDRWDYPFMSDRKEDISFKEILLYASEILEKENFQKMLIIAWAIWFERNKRTHGHPARQGQQVFEWTETIGFGAIILSPEKEVIAALSKPLKGMLSAFQAEAIALLVALNWAQRLGIQLDVIFSDSLSLVLA